MSGRLTPSIDQLVKCLRYLPGVGPKSATRMALHLLERNQDRAAELAIALSEALTRVKRCTCCQNFTEEELCAICSDPRRTEKQICVVESPTDVVAFEQTSAYRGRYFVLMGHLSPIDGIGPREIGMDKLQSRLHEAEVEEVILATNPTVEGEATAHYVAEIAKSLNLTVSRIAHGIPVGGELGMLDAGTLSHALEGRKSLL
ncbi:recombination mediator RecR [Hahella ganghwensis]|uniref:recombination mediator RecR n=1 Tax=Hahella ganghwensis TaxID=286420 RepID=UPI00036378D2|nr:recombination mediator RecR [Hahella ganghwensis]